MTGIREIFKTNLKYYRKLRGLTQEALAEKINCNSKYISEIESRNKFPSAETIDAIARTLDIRVSQLFEEEGSPKAAVSFDKEKFSDSLLNDLHILLRKDILNYLEKKF